MQKRKISQRLAKYADPERRESYNGAIVSGSDTMHAAGAGILEPKARGGRRYLGCEDAARGTQRAPVSRIRTRCTRMRVKDGRGHNQIDANSPK